MVRLGIAFGVSLLIHGGIVYLAPSHSQSVRLVTPADGTIAIRSVARPRLSPSPLVHAVDLPQPLEQPDLPAAPETSATIERIEPPKRELDPIPLPEATADLREIPRTDGPGWPDERPSEPLLAEHVPPSELMRPTPPPSVPPLASATPAESALESAPESTPSTELAPAPESEESQGAKVDVLPRPLVNPHPPYPETARRAGQSGRVLVRVLVGRDGRAKWARVEASSGVASLDESARVTLGERWLFEPARAGGEPVEQEVRIPVLFSLQE